MVVLRPDHFYGESDVTSDPSLRTPPQFRTEIYARTYCPEALPSLDEPTRVLLFWYFQGTVFRERSQHAFRIATRALPLTIYNV